MLAGHTQHFWKRWADEYLITMRSFYKWKYPQRNLQVGDVVAIRADGMGAAQWPKGRIEAVHPDEDGHVRVVSVRTYRGLYTRPIVKLSVLTYVD